MTAYGNLVISTPNNGSGAWHPAVTAEGNGGQFWDNPSNDATDQCNVGFWLQTTDWGDMDCGGTYSGTGGPGKLSFFAAAGNPSTPVGWIMEATNTQQATTLRVEVAGQAGSNVLGWYTANNDGTVIADQGIIFNGAATPGGAGDSVDIPIAAGTRFGFYLCPAGNCANAFLSGAAVTNAGGNTGRFALFSENPAAPTHPDADIVKYWVGVEDLLKPVSGEGVYGDYNDMIFSVEVVPEPAFLGVLGIGLAGLAVQTWRRRKQSV
jgi:hypothetical protein